MTATLMSRGYCSVCGTRQKLRMNGKIGGHASCPGAGKRALKRKPSKPATIATTHVAVLLDSSSSMVTIQDAALAAFNKTLEPLMAESDAYRITVTTFDRRMHNVQSCVTPRNLKPISPSDYYPIGYTLLHDSIVQAAGDLESASRKNDCFLVLIVTDGYDVGSQHTASFVRQFIYDKLKTDRWTFAVSCPDNEVDLISQNLGIPKGNIGGWSQTHAGAALMGRINNRAVTSYTRSRAQGKTAVGNFYVNVGRQDVHDVATKLQQIESNRFRKLTTGKACKIQEFIELKKLQFKRGCAFYRLEKPETVQDYKEIVLQRKDTGAMYGGPNVRSVLGLPATGSGKVKPGNLGEWNVWIQSTSDNRKLLAKMNVLYDKKA